MKQVNKKVLKVVETVMRNEAVYGIDRFPPACMGICLLYTSGVIVEHYRKLEAGITGISVDKVLTPVSYTHLVHMLIELIRKKE